MPTTRSIALFYILTIILSGSRPGDGSCSLPTEWQNLDWFTHYTSAVNIKKYTSSNTLSWDDWGDNVPSADLDCIVGNGNSTNYSYIMRFVVLPTILICVRETLGDAGVSMVRRYHYISGSAQSTAACDAQFGTETELEWHLKYPAILTEGESPLQPGVYQTTYEETAGSVMCGGDASSVTTVTNNTFLINTCYSGESSYARPLVRNLTVVDRVSGSVIDDSATYGDAMLLYDNMDPSKPRFYCARYTEAYGKFLFSINTADQNTIKCYVKKSYAEAGTNYISFVLYTGLTTEAPSTEAPTTAAATTAGATTASLTTVVPTTTSPTTSIPTTAGPSTVAPTTADHTTASPTTATPTTASPTTVSSTTVDPTTASPTTVAPITGSPTTASPTTVDPTTASPTTVAPTTGSPTTASPTTVDPTTASPTTVAPTTGSPTTASPTTVDPTTGSPTTASPTTVTPTTAGPTTVTPTTAGPTTASPSTASPTTASPTTASPTTVDPTTVTPTTASPTTAAPTTVIPTTGGPTTASPTTASPTTASPTTASPTTVDPTTVIPTTTSPTTAAPTTVTPTTGDPTTVAPTTTGPTTSSPTTAAPTSVSSTTDRPTTTSSPTDSTTTAAPTTISTTTTKPQDSKHVQIKASNDYRDTVGNNPDGTNLVLQGQLQIQTGASSDQIKNVATSPGSVLIDFDVTASAAGTGRPVDDIVSDLRVKLQLNSLLLSSTTGDVLLLDSSFFNVQTILPGGPCSSSPCQNGGSCVATSSVAFKCTCLLPFIGPTCDTDGAVPSDNLGNTVLIALLATFAALLLLVIAIGVATCMSRRRTLSRLSGHHDNKAYEMEAPFHKAKTWTVSYLRDDKCYYSF